VISGYQTTDILNIQAIDNSSNGGYVAWSAWGDTTCTTTTEKQQVTPCTGWINNFSVWRGNDENNKSTFASSFIYTTASDALNAAPLVQLTGFTSYRLFLEDGNYSDNRKGLSLLIEVERPHGNAPIPASLALVGLGLAGFGYRFRRQKYR
jgi:hypothetical protein